MVSRCVVSGKQEAVGVGCRGARVSDRTGRGGAGAGRAGARPHGGSTPPRLARSPSFRPREQVRSHAMRPRARRTRQPRDKHAPARASDVTALRCYVPSARS